MINPGAVPSWRGANGLYVARKLGLTSGLKLVLDAGDKDSYTSGQPWLDLSGNGYDFNRGASSSAAGDDPTFNGTAGGLTSAEYWSFDAGDQFRYDTTNETWMQNLHKAAAKLTAIFWVYPPLVAATNGLFGTNGTGSGGGIGCHFQYASTGVLTFRVANTPTNCLSASSSGVLVANKWQMATVSVDEAGGASASLFAINDATETFNGAYTSPSASNASQTLELAARGNSNVRIETGARISMVMMWESVALQAGQVRAFFNATRGRFGV